jgi:hypothetical protein
MITFVLQGMGGFYFSGTYEGKFKKPVHGTTPDVCVPGCSPPKSWTAGWTVTRSCRTASGRRSP